MFLVLSGYSVLIFDTGALTANICLVLDTEVSVIATYEQAMHVVYDF